MFAKLLKYEWKATARLLGILSLCALGVGLLGGGVIRMIAYLTSKAVNDGMAALLIAAFAFLLVGLFMALVLYGTGTQFYLLFRFYKTKFTDEGYLTFTLPVKNRSIFLASYVNILLWAAITVVTILAAVAIALAMGLAGNVDAGDVGMALDEIRGAFREMSLTGYTFLQSVGALVSSAATVMIMMGSITAGAVAAKKHKILAAIGIYYGQAIVLGILSSTIQVFATFLSFAYNQPENMYLLVSAMTYVLQAAWGIGAYLLSMHLINKKLNLP